MTRVTDDEISGRMTAQELIQNVARKLLEIGTLIGNYAIVSNQIYQCRNRC
jgi:hypothetical protein